MRTNRMIPALLPILTFVLSSCITPTTIKFEPAYEEARMKKIPAAAKPSVFFDGDAQSLLGKGYIQLGSVYYEKLYVKGEPDGEKMDETAKRAIINGLKTGRKSYEGAMAKEATARGGELIGSVRVDLREDFRVKEVCLETKETKRYNFTTKRYDTEYVCVRKGAIHYYDYYVRVSANVYAKPPAGMFTEEEIAMKANEKNANGLISAYFRLRQSANTGSSAASVDRNAEQLVAYLKNRGSAGGDFMGERFALHAAVMLEDAPAVKSLLGTKPDLNKPFAMPWRFAENAPLENTEFPPLLATCAHHRSVEIMALLLEGGADPRIMVRQRGQADEPLLSHIICERIIAKRPAAEFATLLVGRGADIDGADREGTTPLMIAAYDGDIALLETLIRRGADLNRTGEKSRVNRLNGTRVEMKETALHMAVKSFIAPLEKARALLEAGCDSAIKDKTGRTALDAMRSALAYDEEELRKADTPAMKSWRLENVERDRKLVALLEKYAK